MRGKGTQRRYAGIMALVLLGMAFLPYIYWPKKVYGEVSFGGGEICYSEELVALWDELAAKEDMERTDFIGHMTRTYPVPGIVIYKQQTSVSPGGKWADYEYRNMYCISHSRELAENPNTTMETTAIWYMKKEPYTLGNLPDSIISGTADEYQRRFNFLLMAYGANHEAYQGTVNSDPVIHTANYYLCQSFCTLSEEARFTGDRAHDWGMYRQHAAQIANRYNPSGLGSTQVYSEMMRDMESTFNAVWNTAKVAADCVESSDSGYVFHPVITLEEDGMYHARYLLTPDTKEFFESAAIIPHGDWSCEVTENEIDFKSQTGQLTEDGYAAEIDLGNVNGIIRKTIGNESVRELHMPVKLGNQWSLTFAQGNLIANLTDGLRIVVGNPASDRPTSSTVPYPSAPTVTRYKHTEKWQADYVVNLRKLDSETGKPLEGAWFDILEAFDDSQLEGSILEDDNWDNDGGSQFLRWNGWDSPYGENGDRDPCEKDQEVTDSDGWLVEADSFGAGELQPSGVRAHRDTKYYSYTKGYCGGHPEPESGDDEEEDDEAMEEYERQIEICESLEAAGGFYHSLDGGAKDLLKDDRDRHYEEFVSLTYDYSARELAARNGYILHNQDPIHEPFENIFDGIHQDTVPVETVTVYSSQYYALEGGDWEDGEEADRRDEEISEEALFLKSMTREIVDAKAQERKTGDGKDRDEERVEGGVEDGGIADRNIVNGKIAEEESADRDSMKEDWMQSVATGSNAVFIKTEVLPGEEVDLENVWILDEDEMYEDASPSNASVFDSGLLERIRLLPGMVRSAEHREGDTNTGRKQDHQDGKRLQGRRMRQDEEGDGAGSVRSSVVMEESQIAPLTFADPDYSGNGGADWIFEVYDHRTEAEVHINKRDLLLKQGENEEYDSYGDTQGDGSLEGAVYGLYAAEDLFHPDGKTGVVFEKGNLVAVAATDKNGDASFMAITEAPGTIYDYDLGMTVHTGFTGPQNAHIQKIRRHTSNPDKRDGEQWYYPIQDNQSDNGNCWIGRPLLLGGYYVQELTRSEGYELSVYGVDAQISNRNSWLAGGSTETKGRVQVKKAGGNIRLMEDTQKEEMVTEITLSGSGADYGYDIFLKNIALETKPSFWLTLVGKKEVYREWEEPEIYYESVEAVRDTLVMINGKSVEAQPGESKVLPNGEHVTIRHTKEAAVSPKDQILTGPKGAIRTFDTQYIPELTGILGGDEESFIDACNQAMTEIGLKEPGEASPYFLVELGESGDWAQRLYDFFAREDGPAFNGAKLEKMIQQNGKTYGVLRYSFLADNQELPVVFSASDQTFYIKYPADFSNGAKGYVYRGYPLSQLSQEDYEMGIYLYRWIRVPNVKPERQIDLYEDLSQIPYVSAQEFRSYWVYGEGELLRAEDGSVYQKECTRYIEKSGYQVAEATSYEEMEAVYDPVTCTWKLHGTPEQISQDGDLMITIRYENRFGGGGGSVFVTAAPSMNLTGTYVKPVILAYPGQYSVYEDAGTRQVPITVSERAIIQKIQVKKDIEKTSYYNTNSYGTIHEDWFTKLFAGYGQDEPAEASSGKMDQFRFKVYLRSNLTRLYRWEDGQVIWQDRLGADMDQSKVLTENHRFPGKVRKIYTKVLHQTDPLYQDSRDSIVANERLYEYTDGRIHEEPEKGYTAILETIERTVEDKEGVRIVKGYNYDKFFDAIETANHDKWDDKAPSYTSWKPIGNQGNRGKETIENARVSDQVRQFAIDWYLQDEVKKLTVPVKESTAEGSRESLEESQAAGGSIGYPDEIYDRALWEAIKKAENYLKPFFAYDLDEIYAVQWDEEEEGGSDKDGSTLSADSLCAEGDGYYGISAYLPYGTYVVAEQQPKYSGSEYSTNLKDFKNKHYQIDQPKEVSLPAVYDGYVDSGASLEAPNGYYCYDASMLQSEMERKYRIRFNQESHVILAHNHHGDFEIYKYGMDVRQISNDVPESVGNQDYFALTQDPYKPYKNYYNRADNRTAGEVSYYLSEGQSGQKGIAPHYRYSSLSEHRGTADNVLHSGGISTEDNAAGMWYQDQVPVMHGMQTAYDGLYAPMLVPWSIMASVEGQSGTKDEKTGESDYAGLGIVKFRNRFFTGKLRLEKLDSETHENILHDSAIFGIYAAEREDSEDGNGRVLFYEKDTTIVGTRKFLESMGADLICPVARRMSILDRILGKAPGPGELYTGIVPAGTPICREDEKIITAKGQGQQTAAFSSYSTVLDGKMKAEEEEMPRITWQLQTVGYLETPQPLGAGVYVICEEKAPSGYVRSKPVAVEVYSDKVTYYQEGERDSRVLAAVYETMPDQLTENQNKPQDTVNLARIYVENIPIKLKVEKLKESSRATANTTLDKTVTYQVSGRIDGSLAEIGNHSDYVYAYENGHYLGYGWKKGTLEYLVSRKAAGEQVELVYEGEIFAGYGYVTRTLGTADDENPYVAGAQMVLFDAIVLNTSGDTEDHAYEGLVIERNSANNITRMYIKQGYAGEKTEFVKEKDENGQEYEGEFQIGTDPYGRPVTKTGNLWTAVNLNRPDTDILYYDLDSLEVVTEKNVDGRRRLFGYDRDHKMVPISQIESDKENFDRTDTEISLFAFKGGIPYLELAGGDFTKIRYSALDKILTVGEGTLVYHLDRDGNRDSLVDPYTGMAYVKMPKGDLDKVMVWPVRVHRDEYGNVTARDKITTCRAAVIGENQDGYEEREVLEVTNHSGQEIPEKQRPSYEHSESGSISGTWKSQGSGESHKELTIYTNRWKQNLNGEVLTDENNGRFSGELNPVLDSCGLPVYYQKSQETYDKGTELYDRNGDFVRYQDSDNLEEYNSNAYHIHSHEQLYDGDETKERQNQKKLYHRYGEGYILENVWLTSDKTPNDPFHCVETAGQADILKRVPAGTYIMEELKSPAGYLKGMPTGVVIHEDAQMQHTSMVDKTTKLEISKTDSPVSHEIRIWQKRSDGTETELGKTTERGGSYTHHLVPGAELALFEARKVYSPDKPGGYYLEKTTGEPLVYESTDSRTGSVEKLTAHWVTGDTPIYVEGIPAGAYILEELVTPPGFVAGEPLEVEIKSIPQVQVVIMGNDHTKVEIEKFTVEEDERIQLAGAGFTLYEAALDADGKVIFYDGMPEYDSGHPADSWQTVSLEEYTSLIPAFEAMYREYGAREGTIVRWNQGDKDHEVKCVSAYSPDSPKGSLDRLHPVEAELILEMEDGRKIRVLVWEGDSFEYQFDYRRLSEINEYACSYVTLDGVRRIDYLPVGKAYVLVETKAPEGFSKAENRLILVSNTEDIQRYAVENTEGRLYLSKTAEDKKGELAGACLELYRAEKDGLLRMDEEHLEAAWITGSDGVYTDLDYINDRILPGYGVGDLKPHEIRRLEDGIYWLTERKSPGYYTTFEPMQIEYHQEGEIRLVRAENRLAEGRLEIRKTDLDGKSLTGAVFELAAYRQRDLRSPVFTKRVSGHQEIIQISGLPVGEPEEDGRIAPYFYRLKEVAPPDGYEVNTQIFTWSFEPDHMGQSYTAHEEAKKQILIADKRTRVSIGKRDFEILGEYGTGFLPGAEFALYEIAGRNQDGSLYYEETQPYDTWITEKERAHEIQGLVAGRSYLLKELKAPKGYHLMDPVLFMMSMDGRRIIKISSQVNTVAIHSARDYEDEIQQEDPNGDSIFGVTLKGRYPIRVEYEMEDSSGSQAAHWIGTRDGHTLYKKDGFKEGEIYTITEYTCYNDGTRSTTGKRTEALLFDEKDTCYIPGREAARTSLTLSHEDGTRIDSFLVNEVIQEKTIPNNRLPENPQMIVKNRDGQAGTALDPSQAIMGTIAFINETQSKTDMEIVVNLDSSMEILDSGGGTIRGNQIFYQEKDVEPLERRTVSYVAAAEKGGLSVHGTGVIRYQGHSAAAAKTIPLLQSKKLVIYNELTGSGKGLFGEEESIFEIRLFQENGEELKGRYEYEGSRSGTIQSGGSIALAGNEFVVIDPGFYENVRYLITRREDGNRIKEQKISGRIEESGACAAFTRQVWDSSLREVFRRGESYLLTEQTTYSDQTVWESGRFLFHLDEQAKISSIAASDKKTEVSFSKLDITGREELPGCHMSLKDCQGQELASWISAKEPYRIKGVLTPGEVYYLEEIRPRDGYAFAERISFSVSEDGITQQVVMKDQDTKLRIHKVAEQEEKTYIPGAVLQILNEDRTPARAVSSYGDFQEGDPLIFRSGEAPRELCRQLCAGYGYLLHEVKPPSGYAFAEDVAFTVSKDGSLDEIWMTDRQTHVTVSKTDITGETEIPGNQLRIKTTEGAELVSWVSGTKPYELVGVLDAGETYILEEIRPADGYSWAEEIRFTVSLDGTIDHVAMRNERTQAEILKLDAETKEPVPGAVLQIRDKEGRVIEEWVSDTKSHQITGSLAAGKVYELWEKEAPKGYQLAGKLEFTMPKKAEILKLLYENRKRKERRTPEKPKAPDNPGIPEAPQEPGRITAFYESQTPKEVKEFFDNEIPRSFRLARTGDEGLSEWYRIGVILSFFGMCTAFFAIFMTKRRSFDIIDKIRRKKEKSAEKEKTR